MCGILTDDSYDAVFNVLIFYKKFRHTVFLSATDVTILPNSDCFFKFSYNLISKVKNLLTNIAFIYTIISINLGYFEIF